MSAEILSLDGRVNAQALANAGAFTLKLSVGSNALANESTYADLIKIEQYPIINEGQVSRELIQTGDLNHIPSTDEKQTQDLLPDTVTDNERRDTIAKAMDKLRFARGARYVDLFTNEELEAEAAAIVYGRPQITKHISAVHEDSGKTATDTKTAPAKTDIISLLSATTAVGTDERGVAMIDTAAPEAVSSTKDTVEHSQSGESKTTDETNRDGSVEDFLTKVGFITEPSSPDNNDDQPADNVKPDPIRPDIIQSSNQDVPTEPIKPAIKKPKSKLMSRIAGKLNSGLHHGRSFAKALVHKDTYRNIKDSLVAKQTALYSALFLKNKDRSSEQSNQHNRYLKVAKTVGGLAVAGAATYIGLSHLAHPEVVNHANALHNAYHLQPPQASGETIHFYEQPIAPKVHSESPVTHVTHKLATRIVKHLVKTSPAHNAVSVAKSSQHKNIDHLLSNSNHIDKHAVHVNKKTVKLAEPKQHVSSVASRLLNKLHGSKAQVDRIYPWTVADTLKPSNPNALMDQAVAKFNATYGTHYVLTPHDGTLMYMQGSQVITPHDQRLLDEEIYKLGI